MYDHCNFMLNDQPRFLLSAGPNITDLLQREHHKILAGIAVALIASSNTKLITAARIGSLYFLAKTVAEPFG